MGEMRFERAMSDAESLMWRLEKDPYLSSTFASVMVLDKAPDFDAFRRRLERATRDVPRLRQRVMPTPANISPPMWVDDPDFDIDLHVRRIACPKPGTLREVLDLASLIVADPFDRTRPLWQFIVVEGMKSNKAAIIQKMHHTISDGERGVQLSLAYLDFEPDAPDLPPLEDTAATTESGSAAESNTTEMIREVLTSSMRIPLGVARQVRSLLEDPAALADTSTAAARTLKNMMSTLGDTESARSPLWTTRSLRRQVETSQAPFRETKDVAKKLGGTLNTAFITAAAHAASNYHVKMGAPVDSLRTSMAVSTRTSESGGNAFSLVRLEVPTIEMSIKERFDEIRLATEAAKSGRGSGGLEALAALTATLPTTLVTRIARQQTQTIDFATSNVKGSPIPMYVAGAQLTAIYPIGPLGGVAFNLTLVSYLGSLDMALNIDTAAVSEPELLSSCLADAFDEFLNL